MTVPTFRLHFFLLKFLCHKMKKFSMNCVVKSWKSCRRRSGRLSLCAGAVKIWQQCRKFELWEKILKIFSSTFAFVDCIWSGLQNELLIFYIIGMKLRFCFVLLLNEMLNQHVLRFFSSILISHSPFTLFQIFFMMLQYLPFSNIILIVQWDFKIIFCASLFVNGMSSCIS